MPLEFPNDADGDAVRRLFGGKNDPRRPMCVNFQVAVPDEAAAKSLAEIAWKKGYRISVYPSPECSLPWTCECSTRILADYEGVLAIQNELAELSAPFGGRPDGWGSYGNKPNGDK